MESIGRLFSTFVFIAGLTGSNVFGSLRPKMTGVINDASDVTWAHAVNSRDALEKALAGPVDFLEADISMGHVIGNEQSLHIPIMAHPPDATSDISLDTWLNTVLTKKPEKGLKLDFKSVEVLEPSLIILQKYSSKLNSVWLNADVLSGPINSPTIPVEFEQFLALCHQYFPNATLSTGWTTDWIPTLSEELWQYGWKHVREMADVIRCRGYESNYPKFTFPVRGIFASRSIRQLQWLLSVVPNSTLTVWNGKLDPLQLDDLLRIRISFTKDKVYYDVPGLNDIFQEKKRTVEVPTRDFMKDDGQWKTFTAGQGESCSTLTYVNNDNILFGKSLRTAVLQNNVISLEQRDNLKVTGKVKFFNTKENPSEGKQDLAIVLAEVSLFSKDTHAEVPNKVDLTTSDTNVVWSAINSSTIHTIHHKYGDEDSSCRIFKLDTSEDKSFEVWTVPCYTMLKEDSSEEISKAGFPEISSRKRLVLPKGPFMLGFVSAGEEHVVIYDLEMKSDGEDYALGSSSVPKRTSSFFSIIASVCYFFYCNLFF